MLKEIIIFGTGLYSGVYIAQNYQAAVSLVCKKAIQECDKSMEKKKWLVFVIFIERVENPRVLFEKAQAYIKEKLNEGKDGKKCD